MSCRPTTYHDQKIDSHQVIWQYDSKLDASKKMCHSIECRMIHFNCKVITSRHYIATYRGSCILYLHDVNPALKLYKPRDMKWNESGFRPHLCTYRLNWARRTSWGWWDDWDDTVLQTQDSKFEPWRSEAEHATSRSRRLPTILTFTRGWGRNVFVSFKPPRPGTEPRALAWKAAVITTTLGPPPPRDMKGCINHLVEWQLHPFRSKGTYYVYYF